MKYRFNYNLEAEIQQTQEVVCELEWYKKNGYEVVLPGGISEKSTSDEIAEAVKKEFPKNKEKFEEIQRGIQELLDKNSSKLESFFSVFGYDMVKNVDLFFTAYGSGGGYNLPNKISILMSRSTRDIFETIIHETVHLIIEKPLIEKYHIPHWQKEMIVDILCESSLLDGIYRKNQIQNGSENIPMEYIEKLKFNRKDTLDYEKFLKR